MFANKKTRVGGLKHLKTSIEFKHKPPTCKVELFCDLNPEQISKIPATLEVFYHKNLSLRQSPCF